MFHLTTVEPATYSLLQEIFRIDAINKQFALAGGTSLSLQIGHRNCISKKLIAFISMLIIFNGGVKSRMHQRQTLKLQNEAN